MANNKHLKDSSVSKGLFVLGGLGVISMISEGLYGVLDKYFVSTLGIEEVQAVSLVFGITFLIIAIAMWLSIGGMVSVSTANGRKDSEAVRRSAVTILGMAILGGAVLNFVLYYFSNELLSIFTLSPTSKITEAVIFKANEYLQVFSFASIPMVFMLSLVFVLRSLGYSAMPTIATIMSAVINGSFDYYIVTFTEVGIKGIALATVTGFTVSSVFLLFVFYKNWNKTKQEDTKVFYEYFSIHAAKEVLSFGLPSLGKQIATFAAITIFNLFATEVSDDMVAGWGVSNDIFTLALYISYGLNVGMMPMLGNSYGAGDNKRSLEIINTTLIASTAIFLTYSVVVYTFAYEIMGIYFTNTETIEVGVSVLRLVAFSFPTVAFVMHGSNAMQVLNKKTASLVVGISRQLIFFVPFVGGIFLLNKLTGSSINIVLGQVLADFMAFFIMIYFYKTIIKEKLYMKTPSRLSRDQQL
ncbi:MAG: MATE family efflux transporter [Bacteroidota bacterium]